MSRKQKSKRKKSPPQQAPKTESRPKKDARRQPVETGPIPDPVGTKPAPDPVEASRHRPVSDKSGEPAGGQPFMRSPGGKNAAPVAMSLVPEGDAGRDCWHYGVQLPRRADLKTLFDGIRSTRPRDEHGTVYIRTDVLLPGTGNAHLSYEYKAGVFTRVESPSKDKKAPLLADLLGLPITKAKACGGWGAMDYFVCVAGDNSNAADYIPDTESEG